MNHLKITGPAIRLKVTGMCNRSCVFCNEEGDMKGILPIEPNDEFFECLYLLLSKLKAKRIILTGGEPMLHPKIFQIVSGIKNSDISITTNGTILKSTEEWRDFYKKGVSKIAISISEVSPKNLIFSESKKRSHKWATENLQNQMKNLIFLYEAGLPTRVNIVAHDGIETLEEVFSFLNTLYLVCRFETRILNDLRDVKKSQEIISLIVKRTKAKPVNAYRRAGSSNMTQYYKGENGFSFSTKTSFPYFFEPICGDCVIRKKNGCLEGFYGPRMELRENGYHIRLCLYQQNSNVLIPWEEFIESDLADELGKTFTEKKNYDKSKK